MKMLYYKGNSQVSAIVFVFRAAFMLQWFLLTLSLLHRISTSTVAMLTG